MTQWITPIYIFQVITVNGCTPHSLLSNIPTLLSPHSFIFTCSDESHGFILSEGEGVRGRWHPICTYVQCGWYIVYKHHVCMYLWAELLSVTLYTQPIYMVWFCIVWSKLNPKYPFTSAVPNLTLWLTEAFVPCIQGLSSECPFARICAVILEMCFVHSHSAN